MKFEEIEFQGKEKTKKHVINEIYNKVTRTLNMPTLSCLTIRRYLEILIDDQHFNIKTHTFYDENTNTKLNYKFLSNIAHDYITEHIEDFTKK